MGIDSLGTVLLAITLAITLKRLFLYNHPVMKGLLPISPLPMVRMRNLFFVGLFLCLQTLVVLHQAGSDTHHHGLADHCQLCMAASSINAALPAVGAVVTAEGGHYHATPQYGPGMLVMLAARAASIRAPPR